MSPEQFVYWLQGFAELNQQQPTPEQWKSIKEHLDSVFIKVTPVVSLQVDQRPQWIQPAPSICGDRTFLADPTQAPVYCTSLETAISQAFS